MYYAALVYWTKVKQTIDRTPDIVRARQIYNKALEVNTYPSTQAYQMATEELDDIEIVEETPPPTTSKEQELKKAVTYMKEAWSP